MTSGVMYRVGEGNKPELMQTSKGMFMVPGEKGRMFSNKEVTGGAQPIKKASTGSEYLSQRSSTGANNNDLKAGGNGSSSPNIQIIIQNNNGSDVRASASKGLSGEDVINIIVNDAYNSGPATRAIAARTGNRLMATGDY